MRKCEHFIQANSEGRYRLVDLLAVIVRQCAGDDNVRSAEYKWSSQLSVSTSKLNPLLGLHIWPINLVVFKGTHAKPYLGEGFTLRCFQRLSFP